MEQKKILLVLHVFLLLFSISSVCSKLAAYERFMSLRFCFFYGLSLLILSVYALGWQQVIKKIPLTLAYANKAIGLVWNLIWGIVLFQETLSWEKLLGILCVMGGIVVFSLSDGSEKKETMNIMMLPYVILLILSVLLGSISQVMLKKAALRKYPSRLREYCNPLVIFSYVIFLGTSFLTVYAYKGIPLSMGPVLEATGYFYVTIFGVLFFRERFDFKKFCGLLLIVLGIVIYSK